MRFIALLFVLLLSTHCKRSDQPASSSKYVTEACSAEDLDKLQTELENLKLKKTSAQTTTRSPTTTLLDHETAEKEQLVTRFSNNHRISVAGLNDYLNFSKEALLNTLQNYCMTFANDVTKNIEAESKAQSSKVNQKQCTDSVSEFRQKVDARIAKDNASVQQRSVASDDTDKAISETQDKIDLCADIAQNQKKQCGQALSGQTPTAKEIGSCNPKDPDAEKIAKAFIESCPSSDAKIIGTFKDPYCQCTQMRSNQSFYWSFPFYNNRHHEVLNTTYKGICGKDSATSLTSCAEFNAAIAQCPGVELNKKENTTTPTKTDGPKVGETATPNAQGTQGATCACKHYIAADGSKWCSAIGGAKTLGFQSEYCSESICKSLCNTGGNNCTSVTFLEKNVCK